MCFNTFNPFEKVFISHKVKENQITYQKLQGKSQRKHGFHKENKSCKTQQQPPEVFCIKNVLKNFAKFTGKHLCQNLSTDLAIASEKAYQNYKVILLK